MDRRQRQELDRHITGNYGEDQMRTYEDYVGSDKEEEAPVLCEACTSFFEEEGIPTDMVEAVLLELGPDLADHECDHVTEAEIRCDCRGHKE